MAKDRFLDKISIYNTMKKIFFLVLTLSILLSFDNNVFAQDLSENITVSAFIESNVDKNNSRVEQDKKEILADKTNVVLVTIYVRDKDSKPLADKTVTLYSNRGEVDTIEAVANETVSWVNKAYATSGAGSAKSDKEGIARFKVSSNVSGKAIFKVIVDGYIELNPIEVKFNGLPFPSTFTVTITTPSLWGLLPQKFITLFKPAKELGEIVNTGVNISIPLVLALIIFVVPILLIMIVLNIYRNLRRLRKTEEKQNNLLQMALGIVKRDNIDIDGNLQKEFEDGIKNR